VSDLKFDGVNLFSRRDLRSDGHHKNPLCRKTLIARIFLPAGAVQQAENQCGQWPREMVTSREPRRRPAFRNALSVEEVME
jgi:hypothetical protein